MGRFRRRMYEEYAQGFSSDEGYNNAYKKVKRLKGFYSHLRVYIIVNLIIIVANINKDIFTEGIHASALSDWRTYSTAFFWGIGLAAHALSVFGRDLFFSSDWEQKKIQKYMEKEAANTNKWE
ncbi:MULTISPECIES: 2TM domain-containing protein [Flavobacterium]|uniref:2TM domain-containing protein n=1 Tax=Flavobacterium endoglycinae TaxID=2816357 RepID=A0ABX7QA64_9FLAO|nr:MULTISPECIES: 2TM domain-containing protein [Flavobacterium]QSW87906.1 2TM domain-containing protein [Flavobacterium endoglycinae]